MKVVDYLPVLRKRKWWILCSAMLVLGVALVVSFLQTPRYTSYASVWLRSSVPELQGISSVDVNTARSLADSLPVAQVVARKSGGGESAQRLLDDLSVTAEPNAEILNFGYTDTDPGDARRLAQAFAHAYLVVRSRPAEDRIRNDMEQVRVNIQNAVLQEALLQQRLQRVTDPDQRARLRARLRATRVLIETFVSQRQDLQNLLESGKAAGTIADPARFPTSPSSPNHVRDAGLGLLGGLALGVAGAFLWEGFARGDRPEPPAGPEGRAIPVPPPRREEQPTS